ncbi:hypothetical protein M5G07_11055 [Serratia symbiotica]|nr:hypothetical protein [Serratia symbiotica]
MAAAVVPLQVVVESRIARIIHALCDVAVNTDEFSPRAGRGVVYRAFGDPFIIEIMLELGEGVGFIEGNVIPTSTQKSRTWQFQAA